MNSSYSIFTIIKKDFKIFIESQNVILSGKIPQIQKGDFLSPFCIKFQHLRDISCIRLGVSTLP